jgi:23S rRNA (cytosine1962-C5)-methyltransferase
VPAPVALRLRRDLRRAVRSGHPWIYRDALQPFRAAPGDPVRLQDKDGRFLAAGIAEAGPIGARLWTTRDEPVDAALVQRRVEEAAALRRRMAPPRTDALRVLHGEGDRLGGAVCDRYGPFLSVALDGEGVLPWRAPLVDALRAAHGDAEGILLRWGRRGERRVEVAEGTVPEGPVEVLERGMRLAVDLRAGQKTGLFLDHRESRRRVRNLAEGCRTLNLYGYTGGFSVAAGLGGAREVVTVDLAAPALALARRSWAANGLAPGLHRTEATDVPAFLDADDGGWDLIVADPPSFAPRRAALDKALASYRKLHAACLRRLRRGGFYLAASCSSHVDRPAFEETVRAGASQARVVLQVLDRWGGAPDHPRLMAFPEGDYLKCLLVRVVG